MLLDPPVILTPHLSCSNLVAVILTPILTCVVWCVTLPALARGRNITTHLSSPSRRAVHSIAHSVQCPMCGGMTRHDSAPPIVRPPMDLPQNAAIILAPPYFTNTPKPRTCRPAGRGQPRGWDGTGQQWNDVKDVIARFVA